jgi:hypothetical protein
MYVAASKSKDKAQEFCWNGSPILEFKVPRGCKVKE